MVSPRRIESNRANAKKSTGPKSASGKVRAAQNARRHGLSVPVGADRLLAEQVKSFAQEIADEMSGSELTELASRIAEAEVDLLRIRQMSSAVLDNSLGDHDRVRNSTMTNNSQREFGLDMLPAIADRLTGGSQKLGGRGTDLTKGLVLMDRNQRRSLSRRKFAIRAFDLALRHAGRTAVSPPAATDKK